MLHLQNYLKYAVVFWKNNLKFLQEILGNFMQFSEIPAL